MNYTSITLGELLSSDDIIIKRNAISILKVMQKCDHKYEEGKCIYCFAPKQNKKECHHSSIITCPDCAKNKLKKPYGLKNACMYDHDHTSGNCEYHD